MSSPPGPAYESDIAPTPRELRSDAPSSRSRRQMPSSGRPRGPPSASTPGMHSDAPFAEDVPVRARRVVGGDIPKVVDTTGELLSARFEKFLEEFTEDPTPSTAPTSSAVTTNRYYIAQIHGLSQFQLSTIYVDYTHIMDHEDAGVLAGAIQGDFYRYHPYLLKALHNMIAKYEPQYFREHRQPGSTTNGTDTSLATNSISEEDEFHKKTPNQQTDKIFALAFYNLPLVSRVRQLRTEQIGKLVSMSGTVTRTSEVRPELHLATFICENCNNIIPDVEQIFKYSEPTQCVNQTCMNRSAWRLDIRQSTFIDWQKVRIQENSSEIPTGSMPRTMDVILRGEMVERAKAGEKCIFTGTLIVVPDVSQFRVPGSKVTAIRDTQTNRGGDAGGSGVGGLKALGVRDLTYRMAFLANMVTPDMSTQGQRSNQHLKGQAGNILTSLNQTIEMNDGTGDDAQQAYLDTLTPTEIEDLRKMVQMPNIFMRLVDSLAPTVYGHTVVKKGLLLQLMGGVSKVTPEGMALRGDINICIVGDPSTSKSQFLKYICSFLPRAVYTSGKASSAAGLTAAVVKDEETGEFTIEAGALMLADNGICAIDEFDKMDIADQVAIHEAMEQQTISIAKAGIQATLNARTSILAAANPVGGRYNRKTTLRANINMSAPIMSRFDLFFVVLDECNEQVDEHLARHIVGLHQLKDEAIEPEFSTEQLQRYIRFARLFQPVFTDEARHTLVDRYRSLRSDDAQGGVGRNSYRITVRQLESLIRLSEAIAKATCVDQVTPEFVDEAYKLLKQSIISVEKDDVEFEDEVAATADDDDMADADAGADSDAEDAAPTPSARASATPAPARARTQIKYDDYIKMQNLLLGRVNDDRTAAEDGVEEEDLVTWYLEVVEGELQSQEEMEERRGLALKVLRKMVKTNVLLQIRGEGLADEEGEDGEREGDARVISRELDDHRKLNLRSNRPLIAHDVGTPAWKARLRLWTSNGESIASWATDETPSVKSSNPVLCDICCVIFDRYPRGRWNGCDKIYEAGSHHISDCESLFGWRPLHGAGADVQAGAGRGCFICKQIVRFVRNSDGKSGTLFRMPKTGSFEEESISIIHVDCIGDLLYDPLMPRDVVFGCYPVMQVISMNLRPGVAGFPTPVHMHEASLLEPIGALPSLQLAQHWLNDCIANHNGCSRGERSPSWYPTRLLRIGSRDVQLVETRWRAMSGPYATLSHCWGTDTFEVLDPSTLESLKAGRSRSEFLATFKQCFDVLDFFGISLVWIDSYCILQGLSDESVRDWEYEAPMMEHVYSNSVLTIAAAYATGPRKGLFPEVLRRASVTKRACQVHWRAIASDPATIWDLSDAAVINSTVSSEHLFTRGWVLQERLLSKRVLHFGTEELFWQCADREHLCESRPGVCDEAHIVPGMLEVQRLRSMDEDKVQKLWDRVLYAYSSARLTKPRKDKLMAVRGLANRLAAARATEYAYGLFWSDLPAALCWQVHPGSPRSADRFVRRAPSWSWASIDGPIQNYVPDTPEITQVVCIDLVANVEATSGVTMVAIGRVLELSEKHSLQTLDDTRAVEFDLHGVNVTCIVDIVEDRPRTCRNHWCLLPVCQRMYTRSDDYQMLLLLSNKDGTFSRIGYAHSETHHGAETSSHFARVLQAQPAQMVFLV